MTLQVFQGHQTPREGRFSWAGLLQLGGLVLLSCSWLMPNHYLPWYAFHSDAMAFGGVLACVLSLHARGAGAIQVPRLVLVVLAVIAVPWLQFTGGLIGFAGEAWLATLYLGAFAASIHLGFQWARQPGGSHALQETVVAALILAGFVSTGLCVFQWLLLEDRLGIFIANIGATGRPFGNLAQPNLLATLLVMSLAALVWTHERGRVGAWGLGCGTAFLTLGLSFAQSRAGYLSAGAVALWWIVKRPAVEAPRLGRWWPAAWLLLLAFFAVMLPIVSNAFGLAGERNVPLFDNNGRWLMWKQIAHGLLHSPWFGYGWEHTAAAQMEGAISYHGLLTTAYAHNIILDAMAWFGIPLGIVVCAAGAAWLVSRARGARGQLPIFGIAIILPVVVHSLFEFSFAYAMFLLPVGVMMGAVDALHARAAPVTVSSLWALPLVIALAMLGVEIGREYVPAEEDFRFLRYQAAQVGETPATHARPRFVLLTQLDALLEVGRISPAPGMSRERIERVRFVATKYPWAPPAFIYAATLEANGYRDEASRQMRIIEGMYGPKYYAGALGRMAELREQWHEGRADVPSDPTLK